MKSLLLCLIATSALHSNLLIKGSGRIGTDSRAVENFTQLTLNIPGQVFLQQGPTASVVIEGDDNIISNIETESSHGGLAIRCKSGTAFSTKLPITYKITAPDLHFLQVNGSSSIKSDGMLTSDAFELFINGSADAMLALAVKDLRIQIIGAGTCGLMGNTNNQSIIIQGSGQCNALDLKACSAKVDISGSGSALVFATKSLDVKIRGTGRVQYSGRPKVTQSISGMGIVEPTNLEKK